MVGILSRFLLGTGLFSGAFAAGFREGKSLTFSDLHFQGLAPSTHRQNPKETDLLEHWDFHQPPKRKVLANMVFGEGWVIRMPQIRGWDPSRFA